jgi:uncharacterized membrane protein
MTAIPQHRGDMAKNRNRPRLSFIQVSEMSRRMWEVVRRAFVEFLTIPTLVIAGFLLLALVTFVLDEARIVNEGPGSHAKWRGLFSDVQATRDFLGVIASSIITVTSITLSLLLIAVQQGAAALTSLVFDQFLRRRANQIYFGFFIGLALYSLTVLASINPSHQPIYGVALAGVMTVIALYMLIILIYSTIDQMRPVVIIRAIHDHTLLARKSQLDLIRSTRRVPRLKGPPAIRIAADRNGFLARVDVPAIAEAVGDTDTEVVILGSIGEYVAFGDVVAEIATTSGKNLSRLEPVVRNALALEEQRDLDTDPAFGIEQLAMIGWTSISTAKSNPSPGLLTILNLRDLLAQWVQSDDAFARGGDSGADSTASVVYSDNLPEALMRAFESLAVVASESMQHQSAAEIYRSFANLFHRLPPVMQRQADDLLLRSLSGLGDHILSSDLEASLAALRAALNMHGQSRCASAIAAAQRQLQMSIGRLASRSTRANAGDARSLADS